MDFKTVVMDLDGTLCNDKNIHPKDEKAVKKALDISVPVIPATTRMRFSTSLILERLDIDAYPLICNNGARVVGPGWKDRTSSDDWFEAFLDPDIAEELAAYTDERGYQMTTIFKEKKFRKRRKGQNDKYIDPITEIVDKNMEALKEGPPVSFMMHLGDNGLKGMKDFENHASKFSEEVKIDRHHRSEDFTGLTVYPGGISKKNALEIVCERMEVSMKEVLAIGDDHVDIEMLRSVGKGIAMGNSPDRVKKIAGDVAPDCDENGVAWALKKYVI